jgi:hypothetical protein
VDCIAVEESPPGERAIDMLAQARAAGFSVTERQLARWHYEGLICGRKQSWSKGRAGSETIYPPGSGNQLVALCKFRVTHHRAADIGWLLWWFGFSVDEKYWRGTLIGCATQYDKMMPAIFSFLSSDGAFSTIRKLRIRNGLFRQLRKRVGPKDFDRVMSIIVQILNGEFDGWEVSFDHRNNDLVRDRAAVNKALGRFRRGNNYLGDHQWIDDEIESAFVLMSGRLGGVRLSEVFDGSTEKQIFCARNELRALLIGAHALERTGINDSVFGLKVLAKLATTATLQAQRILLLYFLTLKEDAAFQKNVERSVESFRNGFLSNASIDAIEFMRRTDRSMAELLN